MERGAATPRSLLAAAGRGAAGPGARPIDTSRDFPGRQGASCNLRSILQTDCNTPNQWRAAMSTPLQLPAWKALEAHYQKTANLHMRDLFREDARRFD